MGGKGHAPSQHRSVGGLNHGGHLPLVVQYMQTSQMWISRLCYGESAHHPACRFLFVKKNLTYSKFFKLAVPIEFLVSLLCRLSPVCKTRTLNNQAAILAVEEELHTQLHQSITSYETQTDSPNVCLLKQARSQAKITSKVIHQANPDSLTQTTMSANTDGAIHRSQGSTDLICRDRERMNSQIAENDWQRREPRENKVLIPPCYLRQRDVAHEDEAARWNDNILQTSRTLSPASPLDFGLLEETAVTLNRVFFGQNRRGSLHTEPLIAPDASHGPLMFL